LANRRVRFSLSSASPFVENRSKSASKVSSELLDIVGEGFVVGDIGLLFFLWGLKQFVRLAQRARYGGKPPRAFTELLLRADQPGHVLDRVDLIANGFLQALRKHEPLLGRRGRRLRLDRRARLLGRRPDHLRQHLSCSPPARTGRAPAWRGGHAIRCG
jgi:hypothetical protein